MNTTLKGGGIKNTYTDDHWINLKKDENLETQSQDIQLKSSLRSVMWKPIRGTFVRNPYGGLLAKNLCCKERNYGTQI